MNISNITLVLLVLVAVQTSYLAYRLSRGSAISKKKKIFVDTSVLIDGRIVEVAQTGFIPGSLQIPRSVLGELQLLADKADGDKREKARRGLDIARELQQMAGVDTAVYQDNPNAHEGVDDRLLKLAKHHNGVIMTIDYNLNKVAQVDNIEVLNVNELAKQLRMNYLPGEKLSIALTQAGSDSHQAIGHLDDGTMVVVENARKQIGTTVEIEIIRSLQTDAGRMMFARLAGATDKKRNNQTSKSDKSRQINQPARGRKAQSTQAKNTSPARSDSKSRVKQPRRRPRSQED